MNKPRIAIIGAGFSGLALAYHLLSTENCSVTVFEKKAIGGGASGVSTGLVHPYAGEQGRRSWKAEEGLAATRRLLKAAQEYVDTPIADFSGIERIVTDFEQREAFLENGRKYGDVIELAPDRFLIRSGIAVIASLYLEGLWQACKALGAEISYTSIDNLESLKEFAHIVIAGGAGIKAFKECDSLNLKLIKGQMLSLRTASIPPRSVIAKGYVVPHSRGFYLGSTYEREFSQEGPCLEVAMVQLKPKMALFFPEGTAMDVEECKAGIRVMNPSHYLPIARKLKDNLWVMTAMGSRGLLYHAYIAEQLAEAINI